MKGTEGTALLSFGMDRDGRVLGYRLVRSSGSPELDDEAFAMIVRASPLPPVPPEINAEVVQLVVPVRFRM
jgi:protein TonB